MSRRKILVTAALPYANGDIHLGHLVEYLQTDFWVRFQKMRGHECRYFCADDTHGTPIMLKAKERGITPEKLIETQHQKHLNDFKDFEIEFDNFSSTNTFHNKTLSELFYRKIKEAGKFEIRKINQLYCGHEKMFLPDRFVKGTCPRCGSEDQYGDSCDICGGVYSPRELVNARCALCGETPQTRESDHVFFKLNDYKDFLKSWLSGHVTVEAEKKLLEWFDGDLRDWDISRDAPYFGFEIPDMPGKYFYVWLDAPIGYIASLKEWSEKNGLDYTSWWGQESDAELYHFIGKDILYFHTLFWPAMLKTAGFKLPDKVFVHGFLTVNGEKMSKSKGTFVNARTWLNHLSPLYLRYYLACKMNSGMGDIDLNLDDFTKRVNSDLIGKITNLASRGAQMISKKLDGKMKALDEKGLKLKGFALSRAETIEKHYENRDFSKVVSEIRQIADETNRYFDEHAPWKTVKDDPETARAVLSATLTVFRILSIYLQPVLPSYSRRAASLFSENRFTWNDLEKDLSGIEISGYEYLLGRVDVKDVEKITNEEKEKNIKKSSKPDTERSTSQKYEPLLEQVEYEDFARLDLRAAEILEAEPVEGADKLLRLKLDLGFETRTVIAGIKKAYSPWELQGKTVIMIANLKPKKMRFGVSEGMILAAGSGAKDLFLLTADSGVKPGMRVS